MSSSNGKKDKMKKKGSSLSSPLGTNEYNGTNKPLPGTATGHIWTPCKDLKAWQVRNRIEMVAPVQDSLPL
jgi:hypothetical protein